MKATRRDSSSLLAALEEMVPGASRRTLRQMLSIGRVRVNGDVCRLGKRSLAPGDVVEISKSGAPPKRFRGIQVLYEDDALLVVLKPAGLLAVSTPHERERTLFAYLKDYAVKTTPRARLCVVHRLDKFVSGVMVFAKSPAVREKLQSLFRQHSIERRYWAIVEGSVKPAEGTIESRLVEDRSGRMKSAAGAREGKRAVTHFRVIARRPGVTVLEVALETGRKNQIRVHLSEMGHPILGDRAYGSTRDPMGRIGLHAFLLGFRHPVDRASMRFETDPPSEFKRYLPAVERRPQRPATR